MPQVAPVPTVTPDLDFHRHAPKVGDQGPLVDSFNEVFSQLQGLHGQMSTSINGANEAISAIDTELDARGIVIDTSGTVPTAIFNLRLVSKTSTTIRIVWDKGNETYVANYLMSRQLASGGATTLVAELNPIGDFPSGFATYSGLQPLTSYVLTVQARSATSVLGPASSITVTTSSVEA